MPADDDLLARVRGEYREMPGLSLSIEQACRLLGIDRPTCISVFERLLADGTLYRSRQGAYCAFPIARSSPLKVSRVREPDSRTKRRA